MGISIPNRVVVFDYGEVISHSPSEADRANLEAEAGVRGNEPAARTFWGAYASARDALDEGTLAIRDYWRGIAASLGRSWGDAQIDRLWLADFRSWLSINDETLDLLVELQQGGTRMAMLSNAGRDFASYFRHGALGDFFEATFVSGEVGTLKPHRPIFQLALSALGITPEQMVFIDNKEVNVRGAESLGASGHVFTNASELRDYLTALAA